MKHLFESHVQESFQFICQNNSNEPDLLLKMKVVANNAVIHVV